MIIAALALSLLVPGQLQAPAAIPSDDPLNTLSLAEALNCAAEDTACREAEFQLRGQADQGVRLDHVLIRLCPAVGSSNDFDTACADRLWTDVDTINTRAARSIVRSGAWPDWTRTAARGLWLIIQHARTEQGDYDTAFMVEALPFLLDGVAAQALTPQDYARTTDRILLDQGGKQKFGTIRVCRNGAFDLATISSTSDVDANRRSLGMDISFADLKRFMDTQCEKDAAR